MDTSGQASADLHKAFLDLLEESQSITTTTRTITEIYKLDSLKKSNKGNIRTYEKHSFRISYLIEEEAVYIIRVRYARKEPLEY